MAYEDFHLGSRIKELLKEKRVSQTELADALESNHQNINQKLKRARLRSDFVIEVMVYAEIAPSDIFPFLKHLECKAEKQKILKLQSNILDTYTEKEAILELLEAALSGKRDHVNRLMSEPDLLSPNSIRILKNVTAKLGA